MIIKNEYKIEFKEIQKQFCSYQEEEVTYQNDEAAITLTGNITIPILQKNCPAVLLIAGYGPHDRNLIAMGHQYFLVLADDLARQGIAVLRVDKRGIGKSTGDYHSATTKDFANDVKASIGYLKTRNELNPNHIGVIGFSEGGLIASMIAAESAKIAFAILMAPAIINDIDYLVEQATLQLRADGATDEFIAQDQLIRRKVYSIIKSSSHPEYAEKLLDETISHYIENLQENLKLESEKLPFALTAAKKTVMVKTFNSQWYRYFLRYNAKKDLEKIKMPILALNGNRDWIASANKVFAVLHECFEKSKNNNYKMLELENINHMFQTCNTGALSEYALIKETMSPIVMQIIAEWILKEVCVK